MTRDELARRVRQILETDADLIRQRYYGWLIHDVQPIESLPSAAHVVDWFLYSMGATVRDGDDR